MCTTCSECVADVYFGVKTLLCNIHTRPCTSAHNTCKVYVALTAKNRPDHIRLSVMVRSRSTQFTVHASSQLCHGPPKQGHFSAILVGL